MSPAAIKTLARLSVIKELENPEAAFGGFRSLGSVPVCDAA
jgi:hypothetical protein